MIRWSFYLRDKLLHTDVKTEEECLNIIEAISTKNFLLLKGEKDHYVNLSRVEVIVRENVSDEPSINEEIPVQSQEG